MPPIPGLWLYDDQARVGNLLLDSELLAQPKPKMNFASSLILGDGRRLFFGTDDAREPVA